MYLSIGASSFVVFYQEQLKEKQPPTESKLGRES